MFFIFAIKIIMVRSKEELDSYVEYLNRQILDTKFCIESISSIDNSCELNKSYVRRLDLLKGLRSLVIERRDLLTKGNSDKKVIK